MPGTVTEVRTGNVNETRLKRTLASNLRYLRFLKKPHISQQMLAKHLGITQKSISRYECGEVLPPAYILAAIAGYFGCTVDALLRENMQEKRNLERRNT